MLGEEYARRLPTQSIQLYHLELVGGHCEISQPDTRLKEFIDYYWLLTVTAPRLELEVIPDTAVDLVLSPDSNTFAALYFPVNAKFNIPLDGPVKYAGICFKSSNAATLLGHDLAQLRKLSIGVDTLQTLNIERLASDIMHLQTITAYTDMFNRFWLSRLNATRPVQQPDRPINRQNVLALLQDSVGENNLKKVCQTLDISERQFRRLSSNLFGLSPKKLQNILRLQATLAELLATDQLPEQDLFFDDSHRIKEIKRLTGMTPGEIRQMAENYNQR